jgi:hypothetical protein
MGAIWLRKAKFMNTVRRKLPIGIETFSKIISEDYYYVDKTGFAQQLIDQGQYYFLSRPRRFGKSLFVDMLKELFEANEVLFRGLQIHDQWDWSQRFPVIRISFNDGGVNNKAELAQRIRSLLRNNFRHLGLDCPALDDIIDSFGELIRMARAHYGLPVVVLVDEYDKPILDNLHNTAAALEIRESLKGFYSVIKGADKDIRFAFVTGISKFSKVSMFSGMNNLNDITLYPDYSAICGYTDTDLDQVFALEMAGLDRTEVRLWYNGFNWRGTSVYNPFDLLLLFQRREFQLWWVETGTPAFLVRLMAERGFFTPDLARMRTTAELISTFEVDQITPEALLFQSGYLTIKKTEQVPSRTMRFTLGYPNREVEISLNTLLLAALTGSSSQSEQHRLRLEDMLLTNDVTGMADLFKTFFASIPYHWHVNNPIAQYEGYYASVFYSYFAALGFDLRLEDATSHGRIDLCLKLPGHIWLFEFKVVESAPQGRALQQLKDRAYADKYRDGGVPISLIGVEFSREARNVVGFEVALVE